MTAAFLFPGQGSQAVGMGKGLADAFPEARMVFDAVDDALGERLSRVIFEGPDETLTLTRNTQPALMAVSVAAVRVIEARLGPLSGIADFVAGHSLGEYSALAAAGALSVEDTARLLRIRGDAMQNAVPVGLGAMAAIIGLEPAEVAAVAAEAAGGEVCAAAVDNGASQVVVSGHRTAVERAMEIARARGAKRTILLPVSAPFHCILMAPAAETMAAAHAVVRFYSPSVPMVANVTARPMADVADLRRALIAQLTGMVRFRESVEWLAANGVDQFVEAGAGRVLAGLARRIAPGTATLPLGTPDDVRAFIEAFEPRLPRASRRSAHV